eukprot:Sspe_Gene.111380::Locus_93440_Transcript_2_2_Confidence_0.667_Length_533::g.111380::m.111380
MDVDVTVTPSTAGSEVQQAREELLESRRSKWSERQHDMWAVSHVLHKSKEREKEEKLQKLVKQREEMGEWYEQVKRKMNELEDRRERNIQLRSQQRKERELKRLSVCENAVRGMEGAA